MAAAAPPVRFPGPSLLRTIAAAGAALAVALAAAPADAQRMPRTAAGGGSVDAAIAAPAAASLLRGGTHRLPVPGSGPAADGTERPGALRVSGASLLVPGAGQWMLGSRRSYVYLGLELLGWIGYLESRSDALRLRGRYRDLAWEAARDRSGPRIGGDFTYYEAIARFTASGAWDADPDRAGLQPETDPATHNGAVWRLARRLHLGGEEEPEPSAEGYERALAHYRDRAYRPELTWNWRGDREAARRYRELLGTSDEHFRTATLLLGGVVANHLLSAVDGYLSVRLGPGTERGPAATRRGPAGRWDVRIRVATRR